MVFGACIVPLGLHQTVVSLEPFARNSLDGHRVPVVRPFTDLLVEPHQRDSRVCFFLYRTFVTLE